MKNILPEGGKNQTKDLKVLFSLLPRLWFEKGILKGTYKSNQLEKILSYSCTLQPIQKLYIDRFNDVDGGKIVHYWLRCINTLNKPGPCSETVSVTISW